MNIIEHIGPEGVKSTSGDYWRNRRFEQPKPGDPVDISHLDFYPYQSSTGKGGIARIETIDEHGIHLCVGGASVFWSCADRVSISGGPFEYVKPGQLQPTYSTQKVTFWNWGDNRPGANMGVYYEVHRPLFKLIAENPNPKPEPTEADLIANALEWGEGSAFMELLLDFYESEGMTRSDAQAVADAALRIAAEK